MSGQVPNPAFNDALPPSANNPATIPGNVFQGYTANRPTNLAENNNVYFLTDFGSVTQGFPGIWVADPRDFNNPLAFQKRVFGNAFPVIIPGSSYDVDFFEQNAYLNTAWEYDSRLRGNVGIKVIRTKLKVRQNLTGPTIPYGDTNSDIGDTFSGRTYYDYLPTFNAQYDITDQLKLRFGFAKTTVPLDLGNYGGGVTIATNDSVGVDPNNPATVNSAPRGVRQVTSASAGGNPQLDPWRSYNFDLALEYYYGRATLLNVGLYRLDITSFVTTQTLNDGRFPDGDGVIRRTVPFTRPIQGSGGLVQGLEAGAKIALSDVLSTDSFIRNFGFDGNFTYADSEQQDAAPQRNGDPFPFFDNSKYQYNAALWYQNDKLQLRVAYNRRSPRLAGQVNGIAIFQDTTNYVDVNATYNITPNISIYANGSNVFGEIEKYYYEFKPGSTQFSFRNEFEPRYSAGIRARF